MNLDHFLPDERDGLPAQARAWLVRLKSGDATQGDMGALARWRASSDLHEHAYQSQLRLWRAIGTAATMPEEVAPPPEMLPAPLGAPVARRWVLRGGVGIAACAVAGVVLVGGGAVPTGAMAYETAKGERKRVRLGEGLELELNTASRLFFWPDAKAPRLMLDRGEAMITVAYASGRQVLARADLVEVSARRACFVLRENEGSTRVACLDGDLSVRSQGRVYALEKSHSLVLGTDAGAPLETPVVESEGAWQNGLFTFRDRPAGEVVDELNRYRPGHVYLPAGHAKVRITGVIRLDRIDMAVEHIARSLGMTVVRLPGGVVLLRS